ncbi:MAG: sulfotransferase domain-containing protein [Magnetococcales bacterium]|nr:sulfotransferase domain-containing protein [Magnetococcales bacterium]
MLPTFLGVGASRSGTTSLYDMLSRHPRIFMAQPKEIHYFTFRHPALGSKNPLSPAQYEQLFAGSEAAQARGEISPSYLWVPGAAQRIHQLLGSIPVVILLRNPVERAYSDFSLSQGAGLNQEGFDQLLIQGEPLLRQNKLILSPFHPSAILWKGFFHQQVKQYLDLFGPERVRVYLFDEMIGDFPGFRQDLFSFLEVDDQPDAWLRQVNASKKNAPISDENRQRLQQFYRGDILKLGELLQRDLTSWLT